VRPRTRVRFPPPPLRREVLMVRLAPNHEDFAAIVFRSAPIAADAGGAGIGGRREAPAAPVEQADATGVGSPSTVCA